MPRCRAARVKSDHLWRSKESESRVKTTLNRLICVCNVISGVISKTSWITKRANAIIRKQAESSRELFEHLC